MQMDLRILHVFISYPEEIIFCIHCFFFFNFYWYIKKINFFLLCMIFYNVFGSVVAGAFQITFRVKIHANNFFYFLKIIFDINILNQSKTYKSYTILIKKNFKIFKNTASLTSKGSLLTWIHSDSAPWQLLLICQLDSVIRPIIWLIGLGPTSMRVF